MVDHSVVVEICMASPGSLWFQSLKAKYFPNGNCFFANPSGGSQIWHDLIMFQDVFHSYARFIVRNGESTGFWLDLWSAEGLMCFLYCASPSISISELALTLLENWL